MINAILKYAVPACVLIIVGLICVLAAQCFIEAKKLDEFNKQKDGNK